MDGVDLLHSWWRGQGQGGGVRMGNLCLFVVKLFRIPDSSYFQLKTSLDTHTPLPHPKLFCTKSGGWEAPPQNELLLPFTNVKFKLDDFQKIQKWRKNFVLRFSDFGSQIVKNLYQDHQQHPTLHSGGVSKGRVRGWGCWRQWHAIGDRWHMTHNITWHNNQLEAIGCTAATHAKTA